MAYDKSGRILIKDHFHLFQADFFRFEVVEFIYQEDDLFNQVNKIMVYLKKNKSEKFRFGEIPGVKEGQKFGSRRALMGAGLHRSVQSGIDGNGV